MIVIGIEKLNNTNIAIIISIVTCVVVDGCYVQEHCFL